jgi:hypothetical protein
MTTPKTKLLSFSDLDLRTNAARSARQLVAHLESDLGGHDALSAGTRELIKRAALVGAMTEDLEVRWVKGEPIEIGQYALLTNAQRRLLVTLGLDRHQIDVTSDLAQAKAWMAELDEPKP